MRENRLTVVDSRDVELGPGFPTVPEAFQRSEYEGWLEEKIKAFQLRSYQRTQAERLVVLQQINQIQGQCLALMRNESAWRHFAQEDRLRKKRLDIEEIQLDMRLEELQNERRKPKRTATSKPIEQRDQIKETLTRLRRKLKVGIEARSECERLKEEFPAQAEEIEEEFLKMIWDLRERL